MADTTPSLALPLIAAGQAQKHVTHNEALALLDALVQLAVIDKDLAAPPTSPAEGDRYIVAADPSGAWAGWAGRIARYQDGAWLSRMPRPGWLAFVADEAELYSFVGGAWVAFRSTFTTLQNLTRLGLGTSADAQNPFAAKLNKALWTALATGEGGTGDLRYTLNKQAAGNVLSLLLQTGFSGRAEIGLVGSDNLGLRVSPDGATWLPVFSVERTTGAATFDKGTLREEVAVVTATGPWTKPSWAREVTCIAIGGGGGGGSGRRGAGGSVRTGGGGGGAGGLAEETFLASELAATLSIEIGAGGLGGAAVAADNANGNPGGQGGASRVVSNGLGILAASGGLGGQGGSTGSAGGGLAGSAFTMDIGGSGNGASSSGSGGTAPQAANGYRAGAGGGAGGGLTSGDTPSPGGFSGYGYLIGNGRVTPISAGGNAPGGNGSVGAAKSWQRGFGGGGGGGAGGNAAGTVAGGNGGIGAAAGGPGGGGGASTNGAASGAGADGGRGEVWIVSRG
ncbi:DUF2793 domain-containing protein [Methylorubrum salsuginis]|uniref:Glycine-rich domain-containing protein n=1 Tax=Methylorubrum salsuginis TaxID=414703 RepID=A0A1I4CHP6_9HYPH|nr:DUF2793 domain-containing protein [Methylorubrum salsuginis]SFK79491.1 Protein of unknown function [Methylorubrum salsuginis]